MKKELKNVNEQADAMPPQFARDENTAPSV